MRPVDALLAHQGGWDEFAYFIVPVVVVLLAIRWAERRHRRKVAEGSADEEPSVPGDRKS
jgi:hypothetical protein